MEDGLQALQDSFKGELLIKSEALKNAFGRSYQDLDDLSDSKLISRASPDAVDWELRTRFTRLFMEAHEAKEGSITVWLEPDFYAGVLPKRKFLDRLKKPEKLSFYMRPLHRFEQATDNIISVITSRMYEISALQIVDEDGKVDHKAAGLILQLGKMVLDRKLGSAVQRQLLVSVESTPDDVEKEIKALEAEFQIENKKGKVSRSAKGKKKVERAAPIPS